MSAIDNFAQTEAAVQAPATSAFAITPNNSTQLTSVTRAVYVGGAGNLTVLMDNDTSNVTFTGVPAGSILPIRVRLVAATGTTATSIVGLV